MAGMLPGVESARRRRFHQSNLCNSEISSTRRSSLCLYASSHEFQFSATTTPSTKRNSISESELVAAAREAKKRLDKRLQPHLRSDANRTRSSQQRSLEDMPIFQADVQMKMHELEKKSGLKRLNWLKLNRKSLIQEECVVCLEGFKATQDDTVMRLPCAHKFHTDCLVPWLEGNSHCPCCRMEIPCL